MLNFWLATLVIENKITIEKAKEISSKIGNKPIPKTIEEMIMQLEDMGL